MSGVFIGGPETREITERAFEQFLQSMRASFQKALAAGNRVTFGRDEEV